MLTKELLEHFYGLTTIPVRWYAGGEVMIQLGRPVFSEQYDRNVRKQLIEEGGKLCCVITRESLLFGFIRLNNVEEFLIVGPVCLEPDTHKLILELAAATHSVVNDELWAYCDQLLHQTMFEFNAAIRTLTLALQKNDLAEEAEIYYLPDDNKDIFSEQIATDLNYLNDKMVGGELLAAVVSGRPDEIRTVLRIRMLDASLPRFEGVDELRNFKNYFIGWSALCARAAISGGMDLEANRKALYQFIGRVERFRSISEVQQEFDEMVLYFAEQIEQLHQSGFEGKTAREIIAYIRANLGTKLTVNDIAAHFHQNASYLGHKFKVDTGKTISQTITEQRMLECKRLLDLTDLSLAEIANRMNFSSQQHFQNLFKKHVGMTPVEFRERKYEL